MPIPTQQEADRLKALAEKFIDSMWFDVQDEYFPEIVRGLYEIVQNDSVKAGVIDDLTDYILFLTGRIAQVEGKTLPERVAEIGGAGLNLAYSQRRTPRVVPGVEGNGKGGS